MRDEADPTAAAVLMALGSSAWSEAEIAGDCGLPAATVARALVALARERRVAWRQMEVEGGAVLMVWWAVPVAMPDAWWRSLGHVPQEVAA